MSKFLMVGFCVGVMATSWNVNAHRFEVASNGPVIAVFSGATADYVNELTINFDNDGARAPFISNVANIGEKFDFGIRPAGTQAIFVDRVINTGDWWYSHTPFNDDGAKHMRFSQNYAADGTPFLTIGFEDLRGGGDYDFNDITANVYNMRIAESITAVPEPETYAMLLSGLGLLVFCYTKTRLKKLTAEDGIVKPALWTALIVFALLVIQDRLNIDAERHAQEQAALKSRMCD